MPQRIPSQPSLEFLKEKAKRLQKALRQGDEAAWTRLRAAHPQARGPKPDRVSLGICQLVIAREYGSESWPKLKRAVTEAPDLDFWRALEKGDLALVKSAWLGRPHLLQEKKDGNGALAYAAMYGYSGRTQDNKDIVAFLIEHGAPFNACDAAYLNMPDDLARILDADPDQMHSQEKGWTPLHFAAERGSLACAKLLLERGADVNAGLTDGGAPLAQAAHAGPMKTQPAEDVVNLLIEHGAKVDIFLAAMLGRVDILKRILDAAPEKLEAENKKGERPLHHAAHNLRLEATRLLLERGAAVEAGERAKLTPFIWAAIHAWDKGGLEMLELLLRHGADINRPDREGMTALDYAIEYRFPAVQKFLQARNAKAIRHADKIQGPV